MGLVCGGAVDAYYAAPGFALDGVGRKTLAVGDVVNVHALVLYHACGFEQVGVYGNAAYVVKIGFGNSNSVYLRF